MKTTNPFRIALITSVLSLGSLNCSLAADTNSTSSDTVATMPSAAPTPTVAASAAPVKLSYGVADVLKLSRAQIGEEVILNYVLSSGTIYNLSPREIVYLRDQGVSERVISTMLNQRKRVELAAQTAAPAETTAVPNAPTVAPAPGVPDAGTVPAYPDQSAAPYAEAPLTPPASSVYVIPYSGYNYYPSYPYPYPYYCSPGFYGGWYGPSVAIGFGFGGGGGYYHGGFHGGRGGFHGGFHGGHR